MNIRLNYLSSKVKYLDLRFFLYLIIALSSVFSLWVSIHVTFSVWGTNSDSADLALLYHGVIDHGLRFVTSWRYTQDNWLLSLAPLMFPVYAVFGINNFTLVAPGWVLLVSNAFIGGFISYRITNGKLLSFYFFLISSLLLGSMSLGGVGFMSFLLSHNSSMFYVLLSVLLVSRMIQHKKYTYLYSIAVTVVCFVASISDPWFEATFCVPAIASLMIVLLFETMISKKSIAFAMISIIIGFVLAYTKLFGLLAFLPRANFVFFSSIAQLDKNFHFYYNSILTFINANYIFSYSYIAGAIYVLLFVILLLYCVASTAISVVSEAGYKKFIIYFSFLSVVTISLAYLLSNFPGGAYSGRYLVNVYYLLLIIIIYSILSKRRHFIVYAFSLALFTAYTSSSLLEDYQIWTKINLANTTKQQSELANFLYAHGLKYGYGGYWATDANAVSILSKYKVFIRPVSYEPVINKKNNIPSFPLAYIIGNHGQSSPFWYNRSSLPSHKNEFLVISTGGGEPELFDNSIKMSKKLAIEQFGKPIKTYKYKDKVILVWNKNLNFSPNGVRTDRYIKEVIDLKAAAVCLLKKDKGISKISPMIAEKQHCLTNQYSGYGINNKAYNWTIVGSWLGLVDNNKKIGVGININFRKINSTKDFLNHISKTFSSNATIYFPYPKKYVATTLDKSHGFMMIKFSK